MYKRPDFIIEILSNDKHRDVVLKKDLYERTGVTEYIMFDAESKETMAFLLTEGMYKEQYKEVGLFKSSILFQFNF